MNIAFGRCVAEDGRSTDLALAAIESYSWRCESGICILIPGVGGDISYKRGRLAWDAKQTKEACSRSISKSSRKLDVGSTWVTNRPPRISS